MPALSPSQLPSDALARRLADLVGDERAVQVDFLLHLDAFDQRRAWAEAGYPSLWEYLLRVLHLREGAAWRRIAAMRVLRRFPSLADALCDGRVCMSTLALLGPVLTEENVDAVLGQAAFKTKAETERLVAALAPRAAPRDGVRKLPARAVPSAAPPSESTNDLLSGQAPCAAASPADARGDTPAAIPAAFTLAPPRARPEPVASDTYSLRVTLDADFKAELDELTALLGHKLPSGDVAAVLRVAVCCAIEKYGKRKGAKPVRAKRAGSQTAAKQPATERGAKPASEAREAGAAPHRPSVPAAVRREVWARDAGRCTFVGPDGRRCPSTTALELDHVVPVARGGPSTVANVRLACRVHNLVHAERAFGRDHMARFRRGGDRPGTSASETDVPRPDALRPAFARDD